MLLSLDFPALAALSFVPRMPAQTDADDSEASTPFKPADLTPTRPVSSCTTQTYCTNGVPSGWRPPILWRKSTYYWISLVCLFLATVLAIVAFSIRTSYRGGAFLDKDKLPVLFYAAAVFIGALPLAGVCALFRYESDMGTGWALLCTLLLSFLSLGPIFIFSLETSESDVFTEDRTSGSLAYLVATFCVISSMALCVSAGITYLTIIKARSSERSKVGEAMASFSLGIASLGTFLPSKDRMKRPLKLVQRSFSSRSKVVSSGGTVPPSESAQKIMDSKQGFYQV